MAQPRWSYLVADQELEHSILSFKFTLLPKVHLPPNTFKFRYQCQDAPLWDAAWNGVKY